MKQTRTQDRLLDAYAALRGEMDAQREALGRATLALAEAREVIAELRAEHRRIRDAVRDDDTLTERQRMALLDALGGDRE